MALRESTLLDIISRAQHQRAVHAGFFALELLVKIAVSFVESK